MYSKVCENEKCRKEFMSTSPIKKFCSRKCFHESIRKPEPETRIPEEIGEFKHVIDENENQPEPTSKSKSSEEWHAKYKTQSEYVKFLEEQIKELQKPLLDLRNGVCQGCGRKIDLIQAVYDVPMQCRECKGRIFTQSQIREMKETAEQIK